MNAKYIPLSQLAAINPTLPGEYRETPDEVVSFVPMSAVSEKGFISSELPRPLSEVQKGYTYFEKNDVLLAKITPCMENGKAALADSIDNQVGFGTTEFHVLRPKDETHPRYLFHQVWNPRFRFFAKQSMRGAAGQKRVPAEFIGNYQIIDRSPREQKRVAAILDKADAIRRKRQQAIQLADEFLRSVFLDMFGDPMTNVKNMATTPLKCFGTVQTGNTPPRKHPEYYGDAIEWIKSDNINTQFHHLTKASEYLSEEGKALGRIVPAGSILVTCIAGSRDCIGNTALADRSVSFNQQINAITPKEGVNPFFLYYLIVMAKRLIQNASTNSMKGMVSKSKFEAIQLIAPPAAEQEKFGKLFKNFILYTQRLDVLNRNAESLFGGIAQRAFRGEL